MKTRLLQFLAFVFFFNLLLFLAPQSAFRVHAQATSVNSQAIKASNPTRVSAALKSAPVMFIENVGQFADGARFQGRGGSGNIYLADDAIWVTLLEKPQSQDTLASKRAARAPKDMTAQGDAPQKGVNLKISFVGANPHPTLEPLKRLDTHVSYFIGSDATKWHADVPVWGGVRYKDLYPEIDLEVSLANGQFSGHLIAREGADMRGVQLRVEGADSLTLDRNNLNLTTILDHYSLPLFEVLGENEQELPEPKLLGNRVTAPFHRDTQNDQTFAESISSDLLYSTFLGGSNWDRLPSIDVDGEGTIYMTGETWSSDFPFTPGIFDATFGGWDSFVAKLNVAGSELTYATFLGGSSGEAGNDIAVDGSGMAYVTGYTYSSDFPKTSDAFDQDCTGCPTVGDAFIAKLNSTGSALVYSTLLGGSLADIGAEIAINGNGEAYIVGTTHSTDFQITSGAFDSSLNNWDAFVAKLNPTGTGLIYATFVGGSSDDYGDGISLDHNMNAYITGPTNSTDFPVTSGAFDTSFNKEIDAYVAKLNPSGTGLVYATFLGGSEYDFTYSIAADNSGAAYVTGDTSSIDFPTTSLAFDTTCGTDGNCNFDGISYLTDAFVARLDVTGASLGYGTFVGGNSAEGGVGIAVDNNGKAFITGITQSPDFPTSVSAYDRSCGGCPNYTDAFVAILNASGSSLDYGTFLGGNGNNDDGGNVVVDEHGAIYVTGSTRSVDFPTTNGAHDTTYNGNTDTFAVKLAKPTAQNYDLTVDSVQPVQVLEGADLVKGKATAVKAIIRKTGSEAVNNLSLRLNYGSFSSTTFFVAESSNMDANNALTSDNSTHPLDFATNDDTKTIYFFNSSLAPTGSTVQASVTVDPANAINETDETNNVKVSATMPVYDTGWSGLLFPDFYAHYFRTDWGSTPISSFDAYYQSSNSFVNNVYPIASERFKPDKSNSYVGDTTLFRGSDGRLDDQELYSWIKVNLIGLKIAHPKADRFIAVVPNGWFQANTTIPTALGIALHLGFDVWPNIDQMVIAEANSTARPNGPSVVAHEVGHSYGFNRQCEDYFFQDANCAAKMATHADADRVGSTVSDGVWVDKHIPMTGREIYNFMGAVADKEYWVEADTYSSLLNSHKSAVLRQSEAVDSSCGILASGIIDVAGTATLDQWYVLPEAELSSLTSGPYTFEYQNASGAVLYQQSFDISFDINGTQVSQVPFVLTIPCVSGTTKIVTRQNAASIAQKTVSANAPTLLVASPNGGEQIIGQATIQWSGDDADNDPLSYTLVYSSDNGNNWEVAASNLATTSYNWNVSNLPEGSQYLVKVIATDGLKTDEDQSDFSFTITRACTSKPAKPVLVKPKNGGTVKKFKVKLNWNDVSCASTYTVIVREGSKKGPKVQTQKSLTVSQFKTKALTSGKTYFWRVIATNDQGNAKSVWRSFTVQ